MIFDLNTFLDDIKNLGKLQSITYDNGAEALRVLSQLTTTTDAQAVYAANKMFISVGEQLKNKNKAFGFIIGKVNKGIKTYYKFNLNAFLLKNGKLVIYKPYNDILSLAVSGSRKMKFNGTAEELYRADIEEIFKNSGGKNDGIGLYANYSESYSWNVPSNVVSVHDLLFTHVKEEAVNVNSFQYDGILVS